MERNVVSLETAKRLKVAEFPQYDTTLMWHGLSVGPYLWDGHERGLGYQELGTNGLDWLAAPTAQEIADQLPREFEIYNDCDGTYWAVIKDPAHTDSFEIHSGHMHRTMAEAVAALWITQKEWKR